ncbi:hypothetical protein BCR42DRAFT_334731 [Absidia repens]|uniref:Suppressor of forked domain-containing protein n=1 Tax=Absidia repens TaxID=90262 RepID=A0A1X2I4B6_9FUNG|nr:hypothetical protein BCR42DRAFT_334731 [Absidia repens]
MRRVYQKSVSIPLNNVEHLWKEYDQWENNLNRLTAKKFLGEKSAAYMTARTALREARPFTDHLIRNVIPKKPKWTAEELEQLNLWKRYIKWEKGNPLHLEEKNAVIERVSYAYQQAFLVLRFYPELWYDYAMYYWELSKPEKTLALLKQGMEILPTSLLLHFAYAEICESRQMLDETRSAFDSLLEQLNQNVEKLKTSVQQEISDIQQNAEQERANMNLGDDVDGELREQLRTRERQIKKKQDTLEEDLKEKVDAIMRQCSLVWIAYMRFARRTEGIKSARALFSKARKSSCRTYHVFIASALMEYHNSKDPGVAGKIFGLGIKSFGDDPAYICEYLDFLIQMNDDNNTRALFERSLATLPTEKASDVWKKFLDYENKYGDLNSTQSVEKRIHEANSEIIHLDTFLSRYSYLDLQPVNELHYQEDVFESNVNTIQPSDGDEKGEDDSMEQNQRTSGDSYRSGRSSEPKRPLLESVHPERYSRPDLNQWQLFKPSSDPIRPTKNTFPTDELKRPNLKPNSPPPPFIPPLGVQASSGSSQSISPPAATQQQQPQHPSIEPPIASITSNLPELISYFVTCLPSSSAYSGPVLNAMEFMEVLRNVNLPSSLSHLSQQQSLSSAPMTRGGQLGGSGNNNAGARDMSSGRGRSRGSSNMKRGGGSGRGRGMKRKGGRDEYEEDYQSHKGN